MKIPFENVEVGVAEYLDREVLSQYPNDGYQRVLIGMGISLILKKKLQDLRNMLDSEIVKEAGVVDENGLIDIDLLRDTMKKQMSNNGIHYTNRLLGDITFNKEDVDVLYNYLVASR